VQIGCGFSILGNCVLSETMTDKFEDIRTYITVVQAKGSPAQANGLAWRKVGISRASATWKEGSAPDFFTGQQGRSASPSGRRFYDPGSAFGRFWRRPRLAQGRNEHWQCADGSGLVGISCMYTVLGEIVCAHPDSVRWS